MDRNLYHRLLLVANRLRQFRLARVLAVVWVLAACSGGLLLFAMQSGLQLPPATIRYWLATTSITAVFVSAYFYSKRMTFPHVAEQLQQRFPSLRQTLSTAIEQRPDENGRFTYLQRSVIAEALQHDLINRWPTAVSTSLLVTAWAANIPGILAFVLAASVLWRLPSSNLGGPAATPLPTIESTKLVVEPGHIEVEKGTSLIVTGTFTGPLPADVTLRYAEEVVESSKSVAKVDSKMRQSLSDPVFAGFVDRVNEPIEYQIVYDGNESPKFRVEVFEYPALVRADASLSYPVFTRLEPKTIVNTQRVTASEQSELTWVLNLNKPVASARLVGEDEVLELNVDTERPNIYRGTIQLVTSQSWKLELVDLDGRRNKDTVTLQAKVLPNNSATIQLTAGGDVQVSPIEELTIAAKIRDDFQVQRAGLTYQVSGSEPVDLETLVERNERELLLSEMLNFESLGVQPGDLVAYSVWAEDSDANGSTRRTSSDIFFAEVRRFEEVFRQGQQPTADQQQQAQQQAGQQGQDGQGQELLELQKEIIVAGWNLYRKANDTTLPETLLMDISEVARSQRDALTQLEQVAAMAQGQDATATIGKAEEAMTRAADQFEGANADQKKDTLFQGVSAAQQAYQFLLQLQPSEFDVVRGQQGQSRGQSGAQQRQRQLEQLDLNSEENRYQSERLAQEQNDAQSEQRQVLSRLRELATRQEDINAQLRELEAALQSENDEQKRRELEDQLQRLREQQQEMLRDTDELQERMQTQKAENQTAADQAQQELEEVRENLQNANESMEQGQLGESIASGSKAAEQLNELQEQARQQTADQFSEAVKEIRDQARTLEQAQNEFVDQLSNRPAGTRPGLRPEEPQGNMAEQLRQQQERLRELLEDLQQTVEASEEAEPLLAKDLYETYRQAEQRQAQERLSVTEQLLDRNLVQQANQLATESLEDFRFLSEGIDAATESVLGSEVESLRRALDQLDQLTEQLDAEIANATGRSLEEVDPRRQPTQNANEESSEGRRSPKNESQSEQQASDDTSANRSPEGRESTQPVDQQPVDQQQVRGQQNAQQGNGVQRSRRQEGDQPNSGEQISSLPQSDRPQSGGQQGIASNAGRRFGGLFNQPQSGTDDSAGSESKPGPLTGNDFVPWTDRLRDVEELVNSPELRWQATEIRQAARDVRSDFNKHAREPKWSEVEELVATPLRELRRKVSQELIRQAAEKSQIVPVDRDPVPSEYAASVQTYYENIGGGE